MGETRQPSTSDRSPFRTFFFNFPFSGFEREIFWNGVQPIEPEQLEKLLAPFKNSSLKFKIFGMRKLKYFYAFQAVIQSLFRMMTSLTMTAQQTF